MAFGDAAIGQYSHLFGDYDYETTMDDEPDYRRGRRSMSEICDWSDMPVSSCQHCRDGKKVTAATEEETYVPESPIIDGRWQCAELACAASIKPDGWSKTDAHKKGWFFQKNGLIWCPEHNPDWVAEWRASKA